jgi:hypothetical protein
MSTITQPNDVNIAKLQPAALAVNLGTNVALSLITLGAFCWLRPKNGGKKSLDVVVPLCLVALV